MVTVSACPRCDTRLYDEHVEPRCLQCGYVKYEPIPDELPSEKTSHMATRYLGTDAVYKDRMLSYHYGGPMGVKFIPQCPWCWDDMHRMHNRNHYYRCSNKHTITIVGTTRDIRGWR